jgi:serine phosphatase RsbU (regulator of sigma subunit)
MSTVYIMGSLTVAFATNLAYTRLKNLAIYSALVFVCALVTVFFTDSTIGNKFMLVMGIATSQIIGMSFIYTRSIIAKNLEAAETRALRFQQQLVDKELEAAQVVQQNLLAAAPLISGMSLSTYYQSAGKTGGDWYGHFYDGEQEYLYLWIGDVTGHGISSALVTGVVCGALYSGESRFEYHKCQARPEDRIKAAAKVVNEIIHEKGGGLLMTMLFCALNLKDGELNIINAGHRFPVVINSEGQPNQLQVSGAILGFKKETSFEVKKTTLNPGDTLFLYTDGLVENVGIDGKALKRSKMNSILSSSKDCKEVVANLSAEVIQLWKGVEAEDDVSIMALTWHHRAA